MSETLNATNAPIVCIIDRAETPEREWPVSMMEIGVGLVGCAIAALLGSALGAYLLLPFGATG